MKLSEYLSKVESKTLVSLETLDVDYVKKVWIQINKSQLDNWKATNKEVNRQMVNYLSRSENFKGDLGKGIMIIGENGTGKTRMLKALSLSMGYLHNFKFKIYSGLEIEDAYKNGGDVLALLEAAMNQKMFGFDDLGEEHDLIKVYGTDINVGVEVISRLYNRKIDVGCIPFATTNLTLDMLSKKYGARIESRIHEMFNVIYLIGKDLRK